uniref:Prefoldin subunit 5 n=1 Tax=Haptolina brevifila TaxID=156173 RepID=A0A7S2GRB5_9EUKA|eukprot:CAMPEP_0174715300 /NCGR_PEP_ID=MMETSP1094-20130205/21143_1 /TAXON_ID=156173 /ORGANISM="Chrysochromulina brevifilum, Strain UTEX LB 985" /LENGTH=161 /DNA_ID=CAMNT_0015914857 /DNA_START=58 /DNA_END=543 /DNA_ORIENTATION=+
MADGGKEQINLMALSLEQLNQLKQSIEEELQGLQGAIQQLQVSRNKLTNSKEALERLNSTPEGTPMLVPMTSSLYVPGETTTLDTVIVDVGTGYFIEKSVDEAKAFLDRKMALIESQAQNVQAAAQFKRSNLQQTVQVMNAKVMEMRAGGSSASGGGGAAL